MISISKDVGALAHCVAHKMEDKMEKKKREKTKREEDGGGGDEKSVAKVVDVLFGICSANRQYYDILLSITSTILDQMLVTINHWQVTHGIRPRERRIVVDNQLIKDHLSS